LIGSSHSGVFPKQFTRDAMLALEAKVNAQGYWRKIHAVKDLPFSIHQRPYGSSNHLVVFNCRPRGRCWGSRMWLKDVVATRWWPLYPTVGASRRGRPYASLLVTNPKPLEVEAARPNLASLTLAARRRARLACLDMGKRGAQCRFRW
jgi:hypothetical protein